MAEQGTDVPALVARVRELERALAEEQARTCIPITVDFSNWAVVRESMPARDVLHDGRGCVRRYVLTPASPSVSLGVRGGQVEVHAWATKNSLSYACVHEQRAAERERRMDEEMGRLRGVVAAARAHVYGPNEDDPYTWEALVEAVAALDGGGDVPAAG